MPALNFSITGARAERHSAVPVMNFRLKIEDAAAEPVHAILLRVQVRIQPRRRAYTAAEQERLADLFGTPDRWRDTLQALLWTQASLLVPPFTGQVEIDLPLTCTYDLEVASAKYLDALDSGVIGLTFLFSGTVFAKADHGFSVQQIPWEKEAAFRLPVQAWRELMESHFPCGGWIRLRRETLDELRRIKAREAAYTWDEVIESLLNRAQEPVG
jgi:hypothetical protein